MGNLNRISILKIRICLTQYRFEFRVVFFRSREIVDYFQKLSLF